MIVTGETSSGKQVWIQDAAQGLECGLSCPGCRSPLVARKGAQRIWHFSHISGSDCPQARESAIHKMAKQVFQENRRLSLPRDSRGEVGTVLAFDSVAVEHFEAGLRFDALATLRDRRLAVEFCVTHEVDDEKRAKICELGISCVEIVLDVDDQRLANPEGLRSAVEFQASRHWIHNARVVRENAPSVRQLPLDAYNALDQSRMTLVYDLSELLRKIEGKFPYGSSVRDAARAVMRIRDSISDMEFAPSVKELEVAIRRARGAKEFGWRVMKFPAD